MIRPVLKAIALILVLIAPSRAVLAQRENRYEGEHDSATITLAEARSTVQRLEAGGRVGTLGPISVAGYNWARDLDLGLGVHAFVISANLGGGILVFQPDGSQRAFRRTWEIRSVQLVPLSASAPLALLTDERDGVGTGFQEWYYRLYSASNGLSLLWNAESYFANANPLEEGARRERVGFVWFGPNDSELWYLCRDQLTGRVETQHLKLVHERFLPFGPKR